MDISKLTLSQQLRLIRAIKNYSQTELAKEIKISTPTISRYERGDMPSVGGLIQSSIDRVIEKIEQEVENGIIKEQEQVKINERKKKEQKKKHFPTD